MEKNGHSILKGMRNYERTNTELQENISDVLSLPKKLVIHHQRTEAPAIAVDRAAFEQVSSNSCKKANKRYFDGISFQHLYADIVQILTTTPDNPTPLCRYCANLNYYAR